jgi:hypothetical protein
MVPDEVGTIAAEVGLLPSSLTVAPSVCQNQWVNLHMPASRRGRESLNQFWQVHALSPDFELVITAGGVGPTPGENLH